MINYKYISDSCEFYEDLGYTRIEAPWWTSMEVNHITKPVEIKHIEDFYLPVNNMVLVASAEQSLLALAKESNLPKGRFYAVTPCFRNEPPSKFHYQYFIKTELMNNDDVSEKSLDNTINDALCFFSERVPEVYYLQVVKTDEGYDIEYKGVELGSYGIRSCPFLDWVYGTGVAEPRLSEVISSKEI